MYWRVVFGLRLLKPYPGAIRYRHVSHTPIET